MHFLQTIVATAVLGVGVQARTQSGFCNPDSLKCEFEAGDTTNGSNFLYSLPIAGITDCSQCPQFEPYKLGECTLTDCEEAFPYEPCAAASC